MQKNKKSIKNIFIRHNFTFFIIFILFLVLFCFIVNFYFFKLNVNLYKNLAENVSFHYKNLINEFLKRYSKKNIYINTSIKAPSFFDSIQNFIYQNVDKNIIINLILIDKENNQEFEIIFNGKSISYKNKNFIYFKKINLDKQIFNYLKNKNKYFFINNKFFFPSIISQNVYLLFSISSKSFFNFMILSTLFLAIFIIIFSIIFFLSFSKYYRKLLNNIHKIYLYLSSLSTKNFNINIEKSYLEELDILIEKIRILKDDLVYDNNYIINLLELIKKISNIISDSVIFYEDNLNIIYLNENAKELFNIKEISNIRFKDLNIDKQTINEILVKITSKTNNFNININNTAYFCYIFNIKDANILVLKNINLKSIENEINFLRNFLPNFSHEFRSPLNAIIGFSEIILDGIEGDISPKIKEDIFAINKSAKTLLFYINQIIDFYSLKFKDYEDENNFINSEEIINFIKSFFFKFIKNNIIKIKFYDFYENEFKTNRFTIIAGFLNLFTFLIKLNKNIDYYFYIIKIENKIHFILLNEEIKKDHQTLITELKNKYTNNIKNTTVETSSINNKIQNLIYSQNLFNKINFNMIANLNEDNISIIIYEK
jgi:signal transduction histidine kinase